MASAPVPRARSDFNIVLICALELEAECVYDALDKIWDDKRYGKVSSDNNAYTLGAMAQHNVVVVHMPGMGTDRAAVALANLKSSFPEIKLALVVGICGGMPFGTKNEEIILGDVIISEALIRYDFGRQYPQGFKRKSGVYDALGPPSEVIMAFLKKLKTNQHRTVLQNNTTTFLEEIQQKSSKTVYPGFDSDILYQSSHFHQHHQSTQCDVCGEGGEICTDAPEAECEVLGCDTAMRVTRSRLNGLPSVPPEIHFGIMGSGNIVMKSGHHRDMLAREGIIAVEMESAGVWRYGPTVVIKGVSDYADSHKRKGWQQYAAATAAACTKAFLLEWNTENQRSNTDGAKTHFNIPRRRVKNFVGRDDELSKITAHFDGDDESDQPRILVLYAMGGQGKSQIALEYCHRARQMYAGIFWINGSSLATMIQSFVDVAQQLDRSAAEVLSDDDARAKFAIRTLEQWGCRWLIVFDNCDDAAIFSKLQDEFLPQVGRGRILFTSRHRGLEELGRLIEIPPMPQEAGIRLLLQRYHLVSFSDHLPEATLIVDRLGNLALAIDQASAYMQYTQLPVDELNAFLPKYLAQRKNVLQHTTQSFWKYTRIDDSNEREIAISAFTTWEMSFRQLLASRSDRNNVAHFLTLSAFFAQMPLDESVFRFYWEHNQHPPAWMKIFTSPSSETDREADLKGQRKDTADTMADLCHAFENLHLHESKGSWKSAHFWHLIHEMFQVSLLQGILPATDDREASLLLHPLIRDWLQLRLRPKERQAYTYEAFDVLAGFVRTHTARKSTARSMMTILPHLDAAYVCDEEFFDENDRSGRNYATLLDAYDFAGVYQDCGKHNEAELLYRVTTESALSLLGVVHPFTLNNMGRRAYALSCLGKHKESEHLNRILLELNKRVHGKEHTETLGSMNNLALVLNDQGKRTEAEELLRTVVKVKTHILGANHPSTLTSLMNLASVLNSQGKHSEAERIHRQELGSRERVLGAEHPSILTSMHNLALALKDHGKYSEAEQMLRTVVKKSEAMLGGEHPDTLISIDVLARVLKHKSEYTESEQLTRAVMQARESVLGKEHPSSLYSMEDLAALLAHQGKHDEAERLLNVVVKANIKVLGKEHPSTLTNMSNLALVLRGQSRYSEAEQMYRAAIAMNEKSLGLRDPSILSCLSNLAITLDDQAEYGEAEEKHRVVMKTREKVLGKEHHDTLTSVHNLATSLRRQGKHSEAEKLQRVAAEAMKRVLGKEHPRTLSSIHGLARVLDLQGKYNEAEQMHRVVVEGRRRTLGAEHSLTLASMTDLACVLKDQRKYGAAESIYRKVVEVTAGVEGKNVASTLINVSFLTIVLAHQDKQDEVKKLYGQTLGIEQNTLGENDYAASPQQMNKGTKRLWNQSKDGEAELFQRIALDLFQRRLGAQHPLILISISALARVLYYKEKYNEAEQLQRTVLESRRTEFGKYHLDTLSITSHLAITLTSQGKYDEAEQLHRTVVEARQKVLDPEHAGILNSMGHLVAILNAQARNTEAEDIQLQLVQSSLMILGRKHAKTVERVAKLRSIWTELGRDTSEIEIKLQNILSEKQEVGSNVDDNK